VANADGSDQQQLFGPMPTIPGWVEWSPQADVIALTLDDDPSRIRMIRADGSGISVIETGLKTAFSPIFRPPDGRQLTFRGEAPDGTMGIYVIGRDGSDLRRLELDPGFETDPAYAVDAPYYFNAPQWSADGQTMLYHQLEPDPASPEGAGFRIHQATVGPAGEVTDERILEFDRAMDDEMEPTYLPSGDGFTYQTIDNGIYKLWVVSTAPGSRPRQIGAQTSSWQGRLTSPDGTTLITYFGGVDTGSGWTMRRIDLATGRVTPMTIGDDLSWQRLALPR
jgi:Tol biopolymer transport system component